ncbi:neural cell adhesion molecule L1.1 isoform X1 [Tachysurus ichikawai]
MIESSNGTLRIMDVSHEDTGTYLCSVKATNLSITAHLDVLSKTRIVTPRHDHRTLRGTLLVWPCSYKVDPRLPMPLIQWRKDGKKIQPIAPDNKYTILENGSLMISHILAEDAGNYTCEVITTLDSDVITGSLTVIGENLSASYSK